MKTKITEIEKISAAISNLSVEAMDISQGIYEDADRICNEINDGKHTCEAAADLLADLREKLEEAKTED